MVAGQSTGQDVSHLKGVQGYNATHSLQLTHRRTTTSSSELHWTSDFFAAPKHHSSTQHGEQHRPSNALSLQRCARCFSTEERFPPKNEKLSHKIRSRAKFPAGTGLYKRVPPDHAFALGKSSREGQASSRSTGTRQGFPPQDGQPGRISGRRRAVAAPASAPGSVSRPSR